MSMRRPDAILADFDRLAASGTTDLEVRELVWEVIEDIIDSLGRYRSWAFINASPDAIVDECKAMLIDYTTNAYGDD